MQARINHLCFFTIEGMEEGRKNLAGALSALASWEQKDGVI